MRIIADSGSTKTSWVLIGIGMEPMFFNTEGFNPYYVDSNYIYQSILQNFPADFPYSAIQHIYFYGAGCVPGKSEIVTSALRRAFPNSQSEVSSDLFAAAKALVGDEKNFVSILGTGTNSAIFDKGKITYQIPSLGFLLGDEGSGAYMGRKLLSKYARNILPRQIQDELADVLNVSPQQVVTYFYEQKLPNRFSASVVPIILAHIHITEIRQIVLDSFQDYFQNIVIKYPDYTAYTLNVMGSIGFNFKDLLDIVASENGMRLGKIYHSPMEGLVAYHS
ncbi:MAG: N-acetylglucosamine kinase [Pedobacter sp.]|nr:MAG: N-acetylglucosamine kinase [Pedobacter sp.]